MWMPRNVNGMGKNQIPVWLLDFWQHSDDTIPCGQVRRLSTVPGFVATVNLQWFDFAGYPKHRTFESLDEAKEWVENEVMRVRN